MITTYVWHKVSSMITSNYGASQCLNESSIRLYYTNKERNQGSSASTKACQSCNEKVEAIIQHSAKTQCTHKPSCARTRGRTMSSSKRGAGSARTRAISQHRVTSHCTLTLTLTLASTTNTILVIATWWSPSRLVYTKRFKRCLVWSGLVWSGRVQSGPVRSGPVCTYLVPT